MKNQILTPATILALTKMVIKANPELNETEVQNELTNNNYDGQALYEILEDYGADEIDNPLYWQIADMVDIITTKGINTKITEDGQNLTLNED